MNEIEIGHVGIITIQFLATVLLVGGFWLIPSKVKSVVIACAMMFVGYQILEYILLEFITIAK